MRWGFFIWELIFYELQSFCPHLGSFSIVSSSLRFGQISPLATTMEGSNYWRYGYKTQHSYPRSRLITWRRPEVKFGRNVVKKKQHKNYQDEDMNKKLILINNSICTPLNGYKYGYLTLKILLNINYLFAYSYSHIVRPIFTRMYGFRYLIIILIIIIIFCKLLNSSIWPMDRTLTDTTTQDQSGPGINGNEEVFPKATRLEPHH